MVKYHKLYIKRDKISIYYVNKHSQHLQSHVILRCIHHDPEIESFEMELTA